MVTTLAEKKTREQFVEEMGMVMERLGIPRMAGKIVGCLVLSPHPALTSDDLVKELRASRGSISTMTRLLIHMGLLDRVGRPGERRDYFRIRPSTWSNILKGRMDQLIELHDMIERAMRLVSPKDTEAYTRLREMHEFYTFIEREFPSLFERWEIYQKEQTKKTRP